LALLRDAAAARQPEDGYRQSQALHPGPTLVSDHSVSSTQEKGLDPAIPRLGKAGIGWLFRANYSRLSSDLQEDVFAIK
jgi:hypothetical protein